MNFGCIVRFCQEIFTLKCPPLGDDCHIMSNCRHFCIVVFNVSCMCKRMSTLVDTRRVTSYMHRNPRPWTEAFLWCVPVLIHMCVQGHSLLWNWAPRERTSSAVGQISKLCLCRTFKLKVPMNFFLLICFSCIAPLCVWSDSLFKRIFHYF